jgi:hypothetical protein
MFLGNPKNHRKFFVGALFAFYFAFIGISIEHRTDSNDPHKRAHPEDTRPCEVDHYGV